jgi:hypothetical protein
MLLSFQVFMRLSITQRYPVKENLHAFGFPYKTGLLTDMWKCTGDAPPPVFFKEQ